MTATPAPAAPAVVPGKTLGVVALILAILPFQLIGLILGIVANGQSKKAGVKNGPAKAAIIISIILMVLGLIFGIIAATSGAALFGGMIDMCSQLGTGVWEVDGATYTCG
jgi:hypothetical protein